MLEYSSGVRFSGVKDWGKVTQGSAGIQDVDTHAPCWNQVRMCVQIRRIPSALRVFRAGTQYFFNKKQRYHGHEISVKKVLDFSGQKMLKIAGSVDRSGKQVVKTPRVLTPQC